MNRSLLIGTAYVAALSTATALADPVKDSAIGKPGDAAKVDRTLKIGMDEMKFIPEAIKVKPGEPIRFEVVNVGRFVHEFNIGTMETWKAHRDEMQMMMRTGMMTPRSLDHAKMLEAGLMHDDANSVLLEPGESGEIIWTFPEGGEIGFGCNVPGHLEAGMIGTFQLESGA